MHANLCHWIVFVFCLLVVFQRLCANAPKYTFDALQIIALLMMFGCLIGAFGP